MKRLASLIFISALLVAALPGASGQQSARLRVMSLFYANMDVYLDGQLAVAGLEFPFVTDGIEIAAGQHEIAVGPADEAPEASLALDAMAETSYLIVAGGNWDADESPTLTLIDETSGLAALDETVARGVLLHLVSDLQAVDAYANGELVASNVAYGEAAFFAAPAGKFMARLALAGAPDEVVYEDEFFAVPPTITIAVAAGASPDAMFLALSTRTPLNIRDYLAAEHALGGRYSALYEALDAANLLNGLAGEGPFTMFAPTNDHLTGVTADVDTLLYHVAVGNFPPYALKGIAALIMLNGVELTLTFPDDDWWRAGDSAPIYNDIRAANGVIYEIDGLLLPE